MDALDVLDFLARLVAAIVAWAANYFSTIHRFAAS